ncbi:MAG: zf-TFIIB domain-containing protein [Burkholderiales bacterium]|nr:zf-TFIIB domain-containing protein [Burkholderiales bacterium]
MASCPNCYKPMHAQSLDVQLTSHAVDVDACPDCRLLWFDQWESTRLAPRAVLTLFQFIGGATGQSPTPLASRFNCMRCQNALEFTRDLQRTTAFTYWRCSLGHGRLISFNQFLREKNFIRAPSPAELTRLRETVKQISCSQCGAPIDLAADSGCSHCGAPIALVDPEGVAKAIQELNSPRTEALATGGDATRRALSDAQIDALFDRERMRKRERTDHNDLLVVGMQAVSALVGAFLLSR